MGSPIVEAFHKGIKESGIQRSKVCIVSDIPFRPEDVAYLGVDYFHTIRGRTIAFGTGLKLGNLALAVIACTGDVMTLGGNHFIHAGRRNMGIAVVCVNNFTYRMIDGNPVPRSLHAFSAYSTFEEPFNVPHLANSCGAVYTARWTALHGADLARAITHAITKEGLSAVEIIAPGPHYYADIASIDSKAAAFYYTHSVIRDGEDPGNVGIHPDKKIVVGTFTDRTKPSFIESYRTQLSKTLGDKFVPYGGSSG
jgi:2-oxoglutarate ferredoxin oxidoreductase subunit beta